MFQPKFKKDIDYDKFTSLRDWWGMVSSNFEDLMNGVVGWSKEIDTALSNKVDKITGKVLSANDFTTVLKTKLDGLTNYVHPPTHPATMISDDSTHRFTTDTEKATWNNKADKRTVGWGGALGDNANASTGGAVGRDAHAIDGGAVGGNADASTGGAVGENANATSGGAVGDGATTSQGVAIGYSAKTVTGIGEPIDAVQLGSGINTTPKSMKVYGYSMMNPDGSIPDARMPILNDKVDKVAGKGLSTNDFTNVHFDLLSTLPNGYARNLDTTYIGVNCEGYGAEFLADYKLYAPFDATGKPITTQIQDLIDAASAINPNTKFVFLTPLVIDIPYNDGQHFSYTGVPIITIKSGIVLEGEFTFVGNHASAVTQHLFEFATGAINCGIQNSTISESVNATLYDDNTLAGGGLSGTSLTNAFLRNVKYTNLKNTCLNGLGAVSVKLEW